MPRSANDWLANLTREDAAWVTEEVAVMAMGKAIAEATADATRKVEAIAKVYGVELPLEEIAPIQADLVKDLLRILTPHVETESGPL